MSHTRGVSSSAASSRPESPVPSSATTASSSLFLEGPPRPRQKRSSRAFATQCASVENPDPQHADQWNASSVPIYQSATFKGGPGGQYDYTRSGNPTRSFLQHHIAKIANARHAFVVTSGMGALDVVFRHLKPGDEIIAGNDLYGGSNRLLTFLKSSGGFAVHHIDTTKPELLLPYLTKPNSKVRWVLLESPTNPLLQIVDIETISKMVHDHIPEAVVIVDNTMMSPFLQRPLELGADIVYDSATKYLSGHHDVMAGAIYCDRDDLAKNMAFTINSIGNGLSPFDSFLLLRGIKTMAIRLERQQATACLVAAYLHNLGFKVNFPSLADHPGKAIHDRIAKGPGAVLSFETEDIEMSERIVGATRLWGISVSFGAVNSLISMPCLMSHASIDPKVRKERNLPEHLIRLCVGIEDPDDLLDDLEAALLSAGAVRVVNDTDIHGALRLERVRPLPDLAGLSLAETASSQIESKTVPDLITSAPGKVILFGEHAVVHGVTAIAAALDLRCYCHSAQRADDKVSLVLSDFNIDRTWNIADLPFPTASSDETADVENDTLPNSTLSPDPALLARLADDLKLAGGHPESSKAANAAVLAFLYLYVRLSGQSKRTARTFTVRSALPVGAGLGSSAAYSVTIASSLLYLNGQLSLPSAAVTQAIDIKEAEAHLVNSWAFVGERILHGNPSGLDNSVATLGGAIVFKRSQFVGEPPSLRSLHSCRSMRFLLTNTKVPRDTKTLVAAVSKRKEMDPDYINGLLQEVQQISNQAIVTLDGDSGAAPVEQIRRLEGLIDRNHAILNELGVGHPALEAIKAKAGQAPYNLHTKLTGAGGGGCAVTIVPDDVSEDKLQSLKAEMHADGFACYETAVGGRGFGVLALPAARREEQRMVQEAEGGAEALLQPLHVALQSALADDLDGLVRGLGQWAYV